MAILGSTSLTGCNSIPDFIGAGFRVMFANSAAPTSWTRVGGDTENNRMLRVVGGAGGGVGGSASPILNNVVPSHTHSFSTGLQSSNHAHGGTTGGITANHFHGGGASFGSSLDNYVLVDSSDTGGSGPTINSANTGFVSNDHAHGFTTEGINANHVHSGSTDNGSSQTNWAPRYIDMILCSKN